MLDDSRHKLSFAFDTPIRGPRVHLPVFFYSVTISIPEQKVKKQGSGKMAWDELKDLDIYISHISYKLDTINRGQAKLSTFHNCGQIYICKQKHIRKINYV
jgi:hypothetical protein